MRADRNGVRESRLRPDRDARTPDAYAFRPAASAADLQGASDGGVGVRRDQAGRDISGGVTALAPSRSHGVDRRGDLPPLGGPRARGAERGIAPAARGRAPRSCVTRQKFRAAAHLFGYPETDSGFIGTLRSTQRGSGRAPCRERQDLPESNATGWRHGWHHQASRLSVNCWLGAAPMANGKCAAGHPVRSRTAL